jgi:excisionase family DNA binding protein
MDNVASNAEEPIEWLSTKAASDRLGITLRTLYRFIDEGRIPAYQFGRVIRLKAPDVGTFVEESRIAPGALRHLYPEPKGTTVG